MGLGAVGRDGARGFGAAAVAGDQHQPLRDGSGAPGPEQVQGGAGRPVEHRQVMVGVAAGGEVQDVGERQDGAATANTDPGAGFQVLQGGAHDDRGRQSVVLTQLCLVQRSPPDEGHGVVAALRHGAAVGVDLLLRRRPRGAGVCVGGVAHARRGELGEQGLPGCPRRRGEFGGEAGIAIRLLRPLGDAPAPRPFDVVGTRSILIQQEQLACHRVGEFLGPGPDGVADPLHLDLIAGGGVQQAGQLGHALADHLDVLRGDQSQRLRGGAGGQHRC